MEVFTVSVGIGRVAISVRQTRQVVSRLHDRLYATTFGSQPLIVSVLRHQGLRRCVAVLGICSPAARLFTGPSYLSFPVSIHLRGFNINEMSSPARTAPDSLSPYQRMLFKPFGLVGGLIFEHTECPQTSSLLGGLRESRAPFARRANSPNTSPIFKRCGLGGFGGRPGADQMPDLRVDY